LYIIRPKAKKIKNENKTYFFLSHTSWNLDKTFFFRKSAILISVMNCDSTCMGGRTSFFSNMLNNTGHESKMWICRISPIILSVLPIFDNISKSTLGFPAPVFVFEILHSSSRLCLYCFGISLVLRHYCILQFFSSRISQMSSFIATGQDNYSK